MKQGFWSCWLVGFGREVGFFGPHAVELEVELDPKCLSAHHTPKTEHFHWLRMHPFVP